MLLGEFVDCLGAGEEGFLKIRLGSVMTIAFAIWNMFGPLRNVGTMLVRKTIMVNRFMYHRD